MVGSDTFTLVYDAENRLVGVKKNSVSMATFVYNDDGQRVKSTVSGVTTYFVGAYYEVNASTNEVAKYYYAGASRVAVKKYILPQTPKLLYLLRDHLGSTSLSVSASSGEVIETHYRAASLWDKPWDEVRYTTPAQLKETLPNQQKRRITQSSTWQKNPRKRNKTPK